MVKEGKAHPHHGHDKAALKRAKQLEAEQEALRAEDPAKAEARQAAYEAKRKARAARHKAEKAAAKK